MISLCTVFFFLSVIPGMFCGWRTETTYEQSGVVFESMLDVAESSCDRVSPVVRVCLVVKDGDEFQTLPPYKLLEKEEDCQEEFLAVLKKVEEKKVEEKKKEEERVFSNREHAWRIK